MNAIKQMLYLHWLAARWVLTPFILLSLALPMLTMRMIQTLQRYELPTANDVLHTQAGFSPMFPLLAFVVGAIVGITAWSWDHQARHVYALSLPMKRSEYAIDKFIAGLGILLLPVLAATVGVISAILLTRLPPQLHGYPFSFAGRFALASLISYALVFAMAASTVRTTAMIMIGAIVIIVFGSIAVEFLNSAFNTMRFVSPAEIIITAFVIWPGPFAVFSGSWSIVDV